MSDESKASTRRGFLLGLLAGVGVIAAAGGGAGEAAASTPSGSHNVASAVLYRRTGETERYYKTLYR